MNRKVYNEDEIIRYLLGQLDDETETRIEQDYFSDEDYFEFLQVVESSLIEAYAEGKLTSIQKAAFENTFLKSPRRKAQLTFAEALNKKAEAWQPGKKNNLVVAPSPKWWDIFRIKNIPIFIPLAASLLLVSVVSVVVFQNLRGQTERPQVAAKAEVEKNDQVGKPAAAPPVNEQIPDQTGSSKTSPEPLNLSTNSKELPSSITLDSNSRATRGKDGLRRVEVSPKTETLLIKLIFNSENYESFQVLVKDTSFREIARRDHLRAQSGRVDKSITLKLPAKNFTDGEYFLIITGINADGKTDEIVEYAFRVIKK